MSNVVDLFARNRDPTFFQFVGVEILKGVWERDPTPRWFIAGRINDGSEIVLGMRLSHEAAMTEAQECADEFDVEVTDLSIGCQQ